MRFAIVFGSGILANAIAPLSVPQGIAWFVALVIALIFDLAEHGLKARNKS